MRVKRTSGERERERNKKKVRSPTSIEKVDSVELDCN